MKNLKAHRNHYGIIPPHILESIVKQGNENQKQSVKKTLSPSDKIREKRMKIVGQAKKPFAVIGQKHRVIYDSQQTDNLQNVQIRSEGEPSNNDVTADEAYDGTGATYDLFSEVYSRNSIDNNGLHLISNIHYLQGYDNAFWDGEQMVFGDGDEDLAIEDRLFNRFTKSIDIIGHELTHGITQYEANLIYQGQPGALNESFSDVFGSLVKQKMQNQSVNEADWLIGGDLLTENVNGEGIRSMKAPGTAYSDPILGTDPQPAHMDNYVNTTNDNGGVHINSGIPNKAFYETAMEIGGFAWEKAGNIWYNALTEKLGSNDDFQNCADKTFEAAGELFGDNSLEQMAVKNGWNKVGINVTEENNNDNSDNNNQQSNSGCNFIAVLIISIVNLFK